MISLYVHRQDATVATATVPVRWCITKAGLDELKMRNVFFPYLLIIIVSLDEQTDSRVETRYLVPLTQILQYVEFRRPGRNRIFATVVWNADPATAEDPLKSEAHLRDTYLKRGDGGQYEKTLVNALGTSIMFDEPYRMLQWLATLTAEVPAEFFAKLHPRWLTRWVTRWLTTWVVNECDFRRRARFAFTLQPVLILRGVLICATLKLGEVILFWLGGMFKLNYRALFSWAWNFKQIWQQGAWDTPDDVFKHTFSSRSPAFWPLTPIVPLGLVALGYYGLGFAVIKTVLFAAVILLAASVGFLASSPVMHRLTETWTKREAEEKARERQRWERELSYVLCDGVMTPALSALPPERRTLRLRVQRLIAAFCRPFPA